MRVIVVLLNRRKIAAVGSVNKGLYCVGSVHLNYYFAQMQLFACCLNLMVILIVHRHTYMNVSKCWIQNVAEGFHESLICVKGIIHQKNSIC